jgi:hypothetical protein
VSILSGHILDIEKLILKFMENHWLRMAKKTLKDKSGRLKSPNSQIYYKPMVIKTAWYLWKYGIQINSKTENP